MRKSQIAGQVFVYVLAAVVFAFVMIYGYKAVSGFIAKGEEVKLIQLRTDMLSSIRRVSTSSDVKRLELSLPKKVDAVCFIDSYPAIDKSYANTAVPDPLIYDSWSDEVQQDIFLVPHQDFAIFSGNIDVDDPYYLCFNAINSRIVLKLEGKGDHTKISRW